ncbi:MAG TPA: hypothetical protein VF668_22385 [Pyrinomonadaceae bacterium]|jgi:hypothetical protein
MRRVLSTLLIPPLACAAAAAPPVGAAKIIQPSAPPQSQPAGAPRESRPLTNEDVLKMVAAGLAAEVVVEKVNASPCDFDTSPAALSGLKAAGVPDSLLLLMVMSARRAPPDARRVAVRVPEGTTVELETAYTFDSQLTRRGDAVSFRVVNPVVVGGQVVVEKGATATALVTKAERGGHFGRAGRIEWALREVTAADGSRIPVQFSGRAVGDSKGAKVATQMVVMGGLLWPIAPVVLFQGFKRGGNAVVPEGKRFDAAVSAAATVNVAARQ